MPAPAAAVPLRFGRFELQPHERRLLIDGEPVALGARAFDLLLALAERPGRLVAKRALMELVWPGLVVQENNLAAQVSALRKVVGDAVVATIPGRGYRFTASLESVLPGPGTDDAVPSASSDRVCATTAAPALRTNLPAELPALFGRADDLTALNTMVGTHRLVTIVGIGGVGKSTLAQQLLHRNRDAYPQGVCWVELAPVTNAAALPGTVAAALGVDGGHGEPMAALIAAVAPLQMLLALDNAEHRLAEVATLCQSLHDHAPEVHVVVTSQTPIKVKGERVFRLGPLALPDAPVTAGRALAFGAIALFVDRAQAADGRFQLVDSDVPATIEICRALDGLPLAIELAASRVPLLGVQRLQASMQERLKLLTASRNRAAPARQQTLRAALEWSHGFLQAGEARVLRRLGVMSGGAPLPFIQQVVCDADADGDLDAWAVLDALDTLVDRSLVAVSSLDDGVPRYRLLESPHAFALERLDEAGERPALQQRHALALAVMFGAGYDSYFSGEIGADDWLHGFEPDLDNARTALAWARAADAAQVELTIACTLLRALPPSLHTERMALADRCASRVDTAVSEPLRMRVWIELSCAWADTQKLRSRDAAQRALEIARRLDRPGGDHFDLYHALCRVASAAAQAADLPAALAPLVESRALEDPRWPAQRLLWGTEAAQVIARVGGDVAEALRLCRRLLSLDRQRGSHASIALGNLIDAELASGDAQGAARSGAALVASLEGTRHEYSLAFARLNLCAAWLALDDSRRARPVAQASWPQARVFELQHCAAVYLALLAALETRPRIAARLLGYAEALYAARDEAPETNEAAAIAKARALAIASMGGDEFDRFHREGVTLRDGEIAALAFGDEDH